MSEVTYECPRCKYKTSIKCNMMSHLTRKTPCLDQYSNLSRADIIKTLQLEKEYRCPDCSKSYSHPSNLCRHRKVHENDVARQTISVNTVDSHDVTTTNSNNNNSHNTITNNFTINILPFGREDISHVETNDELLKECVRNIATGIPDIVDAIYFNDDKPENQNVRIGRSKHPAEMLVYKADANGIPSWQAAERSGVLQKLVDQGARILITFENKTFTLQRQIDKPEMEHREDAELHDDKMQRLNQITRKAKGKYVPVRTAVLLKAKQHADKDLTVTS